MYIYVRILYVLDSVFMWFSPCMHMPASPSLQAKDQHIDLDVVVEAPLICVPLPLPNQALVVNMGVLTLKNQCLKESIVVKGSKEEEEQTIESVFERFTIALDDFSINRYRTALQH